MKSLLSILKEPELNEKIPLSRLQLGYLYSWEPHSETVWLFTGKKEENKLWGLNTKYKDHFYSSADYIPERLVIYKGYQELSDEQFKNCPSRK